jgi:hypothetical protein
MPCTQTSTSSAKKLFACLCFCVPLFSLLRAFVFAFACLCFRFCVPLFLLLRAFVFAFACLCFCFCVPLFSLLRAFASTSTCAVLSRFPRSRPTKNRQASSSLFIHTYIHTCIHTYVHTHPDSVPCVFQGNENAIQIYSRRYDPQPLVIRGSGAGSALTASGVFADMIRVCRSD